MIVCLRKERPPMALEPSIDQSQTCPLLALPPEVRNQIWQNILVQCTTTRLPECTFPVVSENVKGTYRFCANLLRTCKQVNSEGTPILYGANVFSAHPTLLATLPSFLLLRVPNRVNLPRPIVHPQVMKLIRRYYIFVRLDTDPRYSRQQVEESFNDAEELHIEVFQAMYGSCDFSVLKLFEGVRGVGKVKIEGSLGDRKYADWLSDTMQLPVGEESLPFFEEYVGGQKVWSVWQSGSR